MSFHALIAAAGNGFRFGAELPKQYLLLHGKPVLQHAMERLASGFALATTYVVVAPNDHWIDAAIGEQPGIVVLRCGGKTRGASIRNALDAMSNVAGDDWIVVHDAVRPCIDRASLLRLQTELADDDVGGMLAIPVASTLKRADPAARVLRTEPRAGLWKAQTPQMFRFGLLHEALGRPNAEGATDEAQAVEALGAKPRLVQGSTTNIKITYPEDLRLAAAILAAERPLA
ncbi:MAG: 2-C-methyl-D-erythritol 4-phosphate cytidylyltransferase [Betaproteobacteria bacterium]